MTKRRSEMRSGLGLVQNQKVYDHPLNLCCAGKDIRRRRYVVERFADGWLGGGVHFDKKWVVVVVVLIHALHALYMP